MNNINPDLLKTIEHLYTPLFSLSSIRMEPHESAYSFRLNQYIVQFRIAKITPKKNGQFVSIWQRAENEPIKPYDISDTIDFLVISTKENDFFGQFVFSKSLLAEKDIFSINGRGGKRGIRVYPPWNQTTNKQAQKTQSWQADYFLDLSKKNQINYDRAKLLYSK